MDKTEQAIKIDGFANLDRSKFCYYKADDGVWYLWIPVSKISGFKGMLGSLAKHDVVEHDDGTITVSPSILVTLPLKDKKISRHGYLKKGIWNEV